MNIWSFIKDLANSVLQNIIKVVETLTEERVHVTEDGTIIVEEPLFDAFGQKVTAIVIAGAGLFMLMLPINNPMLMAAADSLIRAATTMWNVR